MWIMNYIQTCYAFTVVCFVYSSAICLLGFYEQWLWPCPTRSYLVLPMSEHASKYLKELIKYLTAKYSTLTAHLVSPIDFNTKKGYVMFWQLRRKLIWKMNHFWFFKIVTFSWMHFKINFVEKIFINMVL